jgi:hypothetical protein
MACSRQVTSDTSSARTIAILPLAVRPDVAAEMCGCTPNFIESEMVAGRLKFKILGDTRVIPVEELKTWFESLPIQTGKLKPRGRWSAS